MTVMGIHWQGHIHSQLTSHANTVHALVVRQMFHPKEGKDIHITHTHTTCPLVVHHMFHPRKGKDIFTRTVYAP